jgi:aspartate/methionine/tyrosine aminotransferase
MRWRVSSRKEDPGEDPRARRSSHKRLWAIAAVLSEGDRPTQVGFGIPVMPQGAFHVFADSSRWTDDSCAFTFERLEKPGVGAAPGVQFGQARKRAPRFSHAGWSIREPARRLGEYLGRR